MIFFKKVSVIGAGLLGGSLAIAMKKAGIVGRISAWSRSESARRRCSEMKDIFDEICENPEEAAEGANLVVLCTPTKTIPDIAKRIAGVLPKGSLVTDVGSVKTKICDECCNIFEREGITFVGSHPMAGSEKIGIFGADGNLFKDRICFVVPTACSSSVDKIAKMWEILGMKVFQVTPKEHDAIVARISHLPHLVSGVVCGEVSAYKSSLGNIGKFSGPGLKDSTRVSSGSPEMWLSIIADNKTEILESLKSFSNRLSLLISAIERDDISAENSFLKDAKSFRDSLNNGLQ